MKNERDYDIVLPKDDTVAPLKIVAEQLSEIGIKNVLINTDSKTKNKIRCNINWDFAWYRDPINYPLNNNPNEDVKFSLSGVNFIIKEHYSSDENIPMKEEEKIDLVPANSIYFKLDNEVKPVMKISNGKFYWKDEEIDDIHNVYERFNEWLTKANQNK